MIEWIENTTDTSCFLSGADYDKKNRVGVWSIGNDSVAVVLSAGKTTRPHSMGRPNEDSAGAVYIKEKDLFFGVVADSHFGGLTSDAVVKTYVESFAAGDRPDVCDKNTLGRNIAVFKQYLQKKIWSALGTTLVNITIKQPGPAGATTLIAAFVHNNVLYYGAIGDSLLYLFDSTTQMIINSRCPEFLNEFYLSPGILETGSRELKPGTPIVLATDGLPECVYGKNTLTPEHIAGCVEESPTATARNLVELAFSKGGEDNLGLVVYSH